METLQQQQFISFQPSSHMKPSSQYHHQQQTQQMQTQKQIRPLKEGRKKSKEKEEKEKRMRYKEYRCKYPGCKDGLKTKYNCFSHIWDIHLREKYGSKESFKSHPNKDELKEICMPYLFFDETANKDRKRRPYDNADLRNVVNADGQFDENGNGQCMSTIGNGMSTGMMSNGIQIGLPTMQQQQQQMTMMGGMPMVKEEPHQEDMMMQSPQQFGQFQEQILTPQCSSNCSGNGMSNGQVFTQMNQGETPNGMDPFNQMNGMTPISGNYVVLTGNSQPMNMNGQTVYVQPNENGQEITIVMNDDMKQQYGQFITTVTTGNQSNSQQSYQMNDLSHHSNSQTVVMNQMNSPIQMNQQQLGGNSGSNSMTMILPTNGMNMGTSSNSYSQGSQQPQQNEYSFTGSHQSFPSQQQQLQPLQTGQTSQNDQTGQQQTITIKEESNQVEPIQQVPTTVNLNPCAYQLLSNNENFLQVLTINHNLKRLHVMGEVFAENGFLQRSDRRYKSDIKDISNALNIILQLTGKTYKYRNDNRRRYGFIAQEVREIIPEVVKEDEDGMLSIDPLSLLPFIVESLKSLYDEFSNLKMPTPKTNEIRMNIGDSLETINEIQYQKKRRDEYDISQKLNQISLGPKSFTGSVWIIALISFILISINGKFPFFWLFLLLTFTTYLISFFKCPNGKWNTMSYGGNFIMVNIGFIALTVTFLMGSALQIFLGVYVSGLLILWLISQKFVGSFMKIFVGYFFVAFIICVALLSLQPTFHPSVVTTMTRYEKSPDYFLYGTADDVQFKVEGSLPWNCMYPRLEAVGDKMIFKPGENPLVTMAEDIRGIHTDRIELRMSCSSIYYPVNQINGVREQSVCIVFDEEKEHTTTTSF